ncbi:MAG: acetylxylan esterase [Victivallales bacterium]|jgi:cephalosporin-C deacetylase-like acetyl esterase|nr:acetylxylan esterase [Victivallales bacterium]
MKLLCVVSSLFMLGGFTLRAEVPELLELVPEAKGYELIAKLNPTNYSSKGYEIDRTEMLTGDLKRVGYLLKLTGNDGKMQWVFTAMDPFADTAAEVAVPFPGSPIFQTYVTKLEVASNVESVKTGTFDKGNIEFWGTNYGGRNSKNIPGASNSAFDFGDSCASNGDYGSMQVHNFQEKQTVFAFNSLKAQICDLGIGNSPTGNPDWTFTQSGKNYKNAELYIVGKYENLKISNVVKVKLNTSNMQLVGVTDRNPVSYMPGETMTFTVSADLNGQNPTEEYYIKWERTGDDGKKDSGKVKLSSEPLVIKTSIDKPGFVRIIALLTDKAGKTFKSRNLWGGENDLSFEGGAGVQPEKLTAGAEEPADFDAFWQKQKARLAAVPMKYTMTKLPKSTPAVNIYAVSVDCAGPRPVTGYLTVPANAAAKSLPAEVAYRGYGTGAQRPPNDGPKDKIKFDINAHGFLLDQPNDYYTKFAGEIKSNKQTYAFDPEQNSDPEKAYFNGMALRVMRSLEFVKSLPEWNGKTLLVSGGSQGGLQTVWAAALDSDVTYASPGIPWCCDLNGTAKGRLGGWFPKYVPALGYYDAVNHAKRIKCQVNITRAGLGDYVCPPSGVAILYNNIKSPKRINWFQGSTHGFVPKDAKIFVQESK